MAVTSGTRTAGSASFLYCVTRRIMGSHIRFFLYMSIAFSYSMPWMKAFSASLSLCCPSNSLALRLHAAQRSVQG